MSEAKPRPPATTCWMPLGGMLAVAAGMARHPGLVGR
jgi:hypothetical protein